MAHPLNRHATHVKRTLAGDATLARPNYAWCLRQVEEHWSAAKRAASIATSAGGKYNQALRAALVERIRPLARKSG